MDGIFFPRTTRVSVSVSSFLMLLSAVLCCVIFSSFGNINTKVIKIEMVDKNAKH